MQYVTDVRALGEAIRNRRHAQRLTQPDLATIANVGIRFIVDLENGKETCQIGLVLKVMSALGMRLQFSDTPGPGLNHPSDGDLDLDADDWSRPSS